MITYRNLVLIALLFIIGNSWGAVSLSNNSIECCSLWKGTITITKATGEPFPNCKVYATAMETRGSIDTTISRYSYFTDSSGKAILSYIPKKPGEKFKVSVSCGENRFESIMIVSGTAEGPAIPEIDFVLPDIDTGVIAAIAFLLFAFVFVTRGKTLLSSLKKIFSKKKAVEEDQNIEELQLSPRHLILNHERGIAAKLAKKHKRKEIKLGHEFVKRFDR
ncbi:MAG: hypothetical protein ABIG39_03290 [Candidatus Micrarchaeota archaeon]